MIRDFIAIDFETANLCQITNSTPLLPPVATTSRTIIMPWPMLKPALQ
jgi:hypothetical protein